MENEKIRIEAKIRNIQWDCEEPYEFDYLPTNVDVELEVDPEIVYDDVSDWLSEEYGYCHKDFDLTWEKVKPINNKKVEYKVYMKGYKGFEKGLICRGKQYKVGEIFEEPEAVMCKKGIHFCKSPLDILGYYSPATSEYCEVEALAPVIEGEDKCVTTRLRITRKFSLKEFIEEALKDCKEVGSNCSTKPFSITSTPRPVLIAHNTGIFSASVSYASNSIAANAGEASVASCVALDSIAYNEGNGSMSFTSRRGSLAYNRGEKSAAFSSGDVSTASNRGAKSVAASNGWRSRAEVSGGASIAVNTGLDGRVRGNTIGCALAALDNYGDWVLGVVDGEKIKPNVWYLAKDGRFVEAE